MNKHLLMLSIVITVGLITGCAKTIKTETVIKEPVKDEIITAVNPLLPGNSIHESGISDIDSHSGEFNLSMSGYKGELFIGIANERFYGTIKFFNWGNGVPQPLTDLKVTEDKIYFKRVIKTKEDLIKYGGTAYFEQDFYGIFTTDKKTIKGYYRYIGTQDNWEAVKK